MTVTMTKASTSGVEEQARPIIIDKSQEQIKIND